MRFRRFGPCIVHSHAPRISRPTSSFTFQDVRRRDARCAVASNATRHMQKREFRRPCTAYDTAATAPARQGVAVWTPPPPLGMHDREAARSGRAGRAKGTRAFALVRLRPLARLRARVLLLAHKRRIRRSPVAYLHSALSVPACGVVCACVCVCHFVTAAAALSAYFAKKCVCACVFVCVCVLSI